MPQLQATQDTVLKAGVRVCWNPFWKDHASAMTLALWLHRLQECMACGLSLWPSDASARHTKITVLMWVVFEFRHHALILHENGKLIWKWENCKELAVPHDMTFVMCNGPGMIANENDTTLKLTRVSSTREMRGISLRYLSISSWYSRNLFTYTHPMATKYR